MNYVQYSATLRTLHSLLLHSHHCLLFFSHYFSLLFLKLSFSFSVLKLCLSLKPLPPHYHRLVFLRAQPHTVFLRAQLHCHCLPRLTSPFLCKEVGAIFFGCSLFMHMWSCTMHVPHANIDLEAYMTVHKLLHRSPLKNKGDNT